MNGRERKATEHTIRLEEVKGGGTELIGLDRAVTLPQRIRLQSDSPVDRFSLMPTTEHTINDAIAARLRETRHAWRDSEIVRSENTGMLAGSAGRPDILVLEPNVSPVVIETELLPAVLVEEEATGRLGKKIRSNGRPLLSAIAVRLPVSLSTKSGNVLRNAIAEATDLEMAMFTGNMPTSYQRWPALGWIRGSINDLSLLVQSASLPPHVVEAAADELTTGVSEAAGLIAEMVETHPGAIHKISEELKQEDGEQTRRMAATILANAFVFHGSLAGGPDELANVKSIEELGTTGFATKGSILLEWQKILRINYWPIFDIARRILEHIPATHSRALIQRLGSVSDHLLESRLMRSHDLTGAVFQKLIADRKYLAAFYTTPAAAMLLVDLTITQDRPLLVNEWSDAEAVKALRIADFACGTGTLLSTAYHRIGQLHELAGGNADELHSSMMASTLIGCDVLPAAAHLTASMLAGAHPTVKYSQSSILTVSYGKQPHGEVSLGSLDLLDPQGRFEILAITAKAAEGMGEAEKQTWSSLPHASFDVVLMNPPFTRSTGHHEIHNVGVPNPMFAAFKTTPAVQKRMSNSIKRLTKNTSAHGNAGEASIFLVLAHRKLKQEGLLGLVMPLSLMSGDAWEESRVMLRRNYSGLILISISGTEGSELSFSADTDMGECIVIGRKSSQGSKRGLFVVLKERPNSTLLGAVCASEIRKLINRNNINRLEDGPTGGTPLHFGDDEIGQVLDAPLPQSGGWHLTRIADLELAQSAHQLADRSRVWLPTMTSRTAFVVPITTAGEIGSIGPLHRDINGKGPGESVRGPFIIDTIPDNHVPTYPVLWAHDAPRERSMAFEADSQGRPLRGKDKKTQKIIDEKIADVFASATHCHVNLDFRFNSQSTAMQFTQRKTIGGRAWISLALSTSDREKALVLWANTTLGLLLQWWHANRQQPGRGCIGKSTLKSLPTLDVEKLSRSQIARAVALFDETCHQQLLPIHQIDADTTRHKLDFRFGREVLDLPKVIFDSNGPLELLRRKLAAEPSIRGNKST